MADNLSDVAGLFSDRDSDGCEGSNVGSGYYLK